MNVYIPVMTILSFLLWYVVIGSVLYFPLYRWQERFIYTPFRGKQWFPDNYTTFLKGYYLNMLIWPVMLGFTIKEEIRYRKKGLL